MLIYIYIYTLNFGYHLNGSNFLYYILKVVLETKIRISVPAWFILEEAYAICWVTIKDLTFIDLNPLMSTCHTAPGWMTFYICFSKLAILFKIIYLNYSKWLSDSRNFQRINNLWNIWWLFIQNVHIYFIYLYFYRYLQNKWRYPLHDF